MWVFVNKILTGIWNVSSVFDTKATIYHPVSVASLYFCNSYQQRLNSNIILPVLEKCLLLEFPFTFFFILFYKKSLHIFIFQLARKKKNNASKRTIQIIIVIMMTPNNISNCSDARKKWISRKSFYIQFFYYVAMHIKYIVNSILSSLPTVFW